MSKFVDNLPLDGEVYVKDDVRVYIYRGYLAGDTHRCCVHIKGETKNTWVARKLLTPVKEQTS